MYSTEHHLNRHNIVLF